VLEGFDVHGLGHNTPAYVHLVVEAVKAAMADRDAHYADPAFAEVPADRLLSEERAAELRARIDPARAATEAPAVRPGGPPPPDDASGTDTTSVNAADRWGNVFSATPSGGFGPMAGDTGLMFGVRMLSFSRQAGHPNAPAPGKRPRTTLSPTLVAAPDGSFWALSSPGGDLQDQALLQVFLNRVEFGMDPQAAVEAPRFWSFHHVNSFGKTEFKAGALGLEKPLRAKAGKALARLGHRLEDGGSDWAAPTLVELLPGRLTGGADPRLGAKAEAW
jgi:gamma-glutamyltranspeptidase / glutathione hydrolase